MFAFGARKLVIPSFVVHSIQTSAIGFDVIASFRSIFGSTEFTILVLQVGGSGYWNDLALWSDDRKTHLLTGQLSVSCGSILCGRSFPRLCAVEVIPQSSSWPTFTEALRMIR